MYLKNSKTVVIKIGSSLLINEKKIIRKKWLSEFAKDIKNLKDENKNIILVSSGAIALGCKKLNLSKKNLKLDKSQAVASIGQIELMNLFNKIFSSKKINISQILLTLEDTEQRRRAINAKRTFDNLFKLGFVPVVNENDSIATTEKIAKKSIGEHGTGGMKTKIDAAKVCQLSGCSMAIANGTYLRPIKKILENNECTWFLPKISKLDARKKWIISSISPKGELVIDDGAINALKKGNSLLAAGIKKVNGKFNKGDHIKILDKNDIDISKLCTLILSLSSKIISSLSFDLTYKYSSAIIILIILSRCFIVKIAFLA